MADNSSIEWTATRLADGSARPGATWNPWHGCVKVSPACKFCYAEAMAARFGTGWGPSARRKFFGEKHWQEPVRWNAQAQRAGIRRKVFCASMADLFEQLPFAHPDYADMDNARARLWGLIEATPALDWLLLTKRPENVRAMTPLLWNLDGFPANVWVGATAEDQKRADERIPFLLTIPAAVRFLSCEPLLGPLDLTQQFRRFTIRPTEYGEEPGTLKAVVSEAASMIHWVIVGGESGLQARETEEEWALSLRDQCVAASVPFFFKQWGCFAPTTEYRDGRRFMARYDKKAAGRLLDGRIWDEMPILQKWSVHESR